MALICFETGGPPSSPPKNDLLPMSIKKHTIATMRNMKTENAKPFEGTE